MDLSGIITLAISIIAVVVCLMVIHRKSQESYSSYNTYITKDEIDEILASRIIQSSNDAFDFVYTGSNLPLGRVSAFLNYFQRTIYDEEPYAYFCKRSSRDNEFREYGCVIARTGVYFIEENPGNKNLKEKDNTVLQAKETFIPFEGLTHVAALGSLLFTIHYDPNKWVDRYHIFNITNKALTDQVKLICKAIIEYRINLCLQKGMVAEITENSETQEIVPEHEQDPLQLTIEEENIPKDEPEEFKLTEKKLDSKLINKGIGAAGIQAIKPRIAASFAEVKKLMNGSRGHGYAAEYANNTMDRIKVKNVESAAQKLDEHGRQVKHGADRLVNNVEIQTKYYKTASETIGAAFEKKQAIYLRSDGSGKMMQIEVPRDQYKDALVAMQKRIDGGQVPNVAPGEDAKNYVRKGYFTYEQSFNIARAGTIESLTVDAATGAVCCMTAAGVTSVIVFALSVWRGNSPKEAAKQCLGTSLSIMGKGTLIYTLTMQLSRKEVAFALAGKAFTADGISQGYKAVANPIYSASESIATKIAGSKVAASKVGQSLGLDIISGRQIIGGTVTFAVVFGPDIVKSLQGKISVKQLIKNSTVAAAGMAGAAAAQAAIPIPVVPAIVGGAVAGTVAKKALDYFIEDDAKEMFRILKEEFIDMTMLSGLSEQEFEEVSKLTVGNKRINKMLQKMFQSDDRRAYARNNIMQEAITKVTKERALITQKDFDNGLLELLGEPT